MLYLLSNYDDDSVCPGTLIPSSPKMPISSKICLFRKHTVDERKKRDTRIYTNLLNLGVNLPTENREHILMNSEGLNIYL